MWFSDMRISPDLLTINNLGHLSWSLSEQRNDIFPLLLLSCAFSGQPHQILQSSPLLAIEAMQLLSLQPWAVLLWVSALNSSTRFLHVRMLFPMLLCHCLCSFLCCPSLSAVKDLKKNIFCYDPFQKKKPTLQEDFQLCIAQSHRHGKVWTSALVSFM